MLQYVLLAGAIGKRFIKSCVYGLEVVFAEGLRECALLFVYLLHSLLELFGLESGIDVLSLTWRKIELGGVIKPSLNDVGRDVTIVVLVKLSPDEVSFFL